MATTARVTDTQQNDGSRERERKCSYLSRRTQVLIVFASALVGLLYVFAQWFRSDSIRDAAFVGMLLGATVILLKGVQALHEFIERKNIEFLAFVMEKSNQPDELRSYIDLVGSIFNSRRMTLSGLIYGLGIGSAPFVLGAWDEDPLLQVMLASFMFSINFVTGAAFYSLVLFLIKAVEVGRFVHVDLWEKENPSTYFLVGTAQRIGLLASAYVCVCISSILFSVLPLSGFVVGYSIFAALVIVLSCLVPTLPIALKISTVKRNAVHEISLRLQDEFILLVDQLKTRNEPVDLSRFQSLVELRDSIEAVGIWPYRLKILRTAGSVILVSALPVFLQFFLERLAK